MTYAQARAASQSALDRGDYDEAIRQAQEALKLRPGDRDATDLLVRASVRRTGNEGQPSATPAIPPTVSPDYDPAIAAARAAIKREDYTEAMKQANVALLARPEDATAKQLAAQAQRGLKDRDNHDRALAQAREAIASGNYDRAIQLMNLVITGWPGDPAATQLLKQAQAAKAANPTPQVNYQASIDAARVALDAQDYETASARASDALKVRPGDPAATEILTRAQVRRAAAAPVAPAAATPQVVEKVESPPPPKPVPETPPKKSSAEVAPSRRRNQEVAVSIDYLNGQGTVTVPIGYSLQNTFGESSFKPKAEPADRNSTYYGGTISYSYKQWVVDMSYSHGTSSGNQDVPLGGILGSLPAQFSITDNWYQAYLRRNFPFFGTPFLGYLRAGISYVQADITLDSEDKGKYRQDDSTDAILGNLGGGLAYLAVNKKIRVLIQVEAEGFYGTRNQDSLETLLPDFDAHFKSASIKNDLYGGFARATVRADYPLNRQGYLRLFADVGLQGRYTIVTYPKAGSQHELLWGPYAKIGLRYSF